MRSPPFALAHRAAAIARAVVAVRRRRACPGAGTVRPRAPTPLRPTSRDARSSTRSPRGCGATTSTPTPAAMIADAHARTRLTAGAYDTITSPARFAEALTVGSSQRERRSPSERLVQPGQPGRAPGPGRPRMGSPPPPTVPPAPPAHRLPAADARPARTNYSLGRVDILPGNVGYIDIRGFSGAREVVSAIKSALEYLQGTDAIIFDLRRNGGGSPFSVNLIISHFTTGDTIASLTVKNRSRQPDVHALHVRDGTRTTTTDGPAVRPNERRDGVGR